MKKIIIKEKSEEREHNPHLKIFEFTKAGTKYKVAFTKKKANKMVRIYCADSQIMWERMIPMGIAPFSLKKYICRPSNLTESDACTILVISGKPDIICGLDEGIISSYKSICKGIENGKLYVMSMNAFESYYKSLSKQETNNCKN